RTRRSGFRRIHRTAPRTQYGAPCAHDRSAKGPWPSTAATVASTSRTTSRRRRRQGRRGPGLCCPVPSKRNVPKALDGIMTLRAQILRVFENEDVNFLVTNRIPRRLVTRFMGWFSRIEQPLIRDISIGLWRFFSDLDLREAKKTRFRSLHDCFVRELKDGARPIDDRPEILVSP